MDARIIDITPRGGPAGVIIWQIETRPNASTPWHREHTGPHTSPDASKLRDLVASEGWNLVTDESA
jgi:hypothetical protein